MYNSSSVWFPTTQHFVHLGHRVSDKSNDDDDNDDNNNKNDNRKDNDNDSF